MCIYVIIHTGGYVMFNLESDKKNDRISKSYISEIKNDCSTLQHLVDTLTGNIDSDQDVLLKMRKKAFQIKQQCSALNIQDVPSLSNVEKLFDIRIEEYATSVYRFSFDMHLPNLDTTNAQDYFETFYKAALSYEKEFGFAKMKRAVVLFMNYYANNEFWVDCDNINYKPFIDGCIKNFILHDDSSKYLQLMSFAQSGYSHTEVYVGSFEEIMSFIKL